ncbi:MAG: hypothetical protein K8L91_32495 [Anaerolineae bacterium]|nr:hypothetical protein [Anaerolineae bacterium]
MGKSLKTVAPAVATNSERLPSAQTLILEIESLLEQAQPVSLKAGTMNVDQLASAFESMREGLSEADLQEIVAAMNEEYLEPTHES